MQNSIDIPLFGGWHLTLFHPWLWGLAAAGTIMAALKFAAAWRAR
jgi:hypothetical protein